MLKTLSMLFAMALPAVGVAGGFELSSPDLKDADMIPAKHVYKGFGCTGENLSPALAWKDAPQGTQSFALTVYDPDAPTGSGWWHWVVVNIPATATSLPAGAGSGKGLPGEARQIRNDYGDDNYGGPCPPAGDKAHRYIFTLYALKTDRLDLPRNATAALAGFMINANQIGKASFKAKYGR